ncbi:hypothetical protein L228DRAFT_279340 [Xylona heveae TC161]|uniref:Uncharacterized protein n=1 Tax=Xylona heveae (strain CBS 132557 / TC161) TaxID=1328760 RepID=A0A165JDK1_XYLHT|nr:hypothetical protein L228DRAFT_279340 [Xylona heveae TC161]KZF26097.1 hypothetical protein L228DRAFT_279340 [Xylona heveae TC161]
MLLQTHDITIQNELSNARTSANCASSGPVSSPTTIENRILLLSAPCIDPETKPSTIRRIAQFSSTGLGQNLFVFFVLEEPCERKTENTPTTAGHDVQNGRDQAGSESGTGICAYMQLQAELLQLNLRITIIPVADISQLTRIISLTFPTKRRNPSLTLAPKFSTDQHQPIQSSPRRHTHHPTSSCSSSRFTRQASHLQILSPQKQSFSSPTHHTPRQPETRQLFSSLSFSQSPHSSRSAHFSHRRFFNPQIPNKQNIRPFTSYDTYTPHNQHQHRFHQGTSFPPPIQLQPSILFPQNHTRQTRPSPFSSPRSPVPPRHAIHAASSTSPNTNNNTQAINPITLLPLMTSSFPQQSLSDHTVHILTDLYTCIADVACAIHEPHGHWRHEMETYIGPEETRALEEFWAEEWVVE